MMSDNEQIAKIDGHYLSTCEERPKDDEHWHHKNDGCCYFDPPPDYRAPENFHELMRVAVEMKGAITMGKWHSKLRSVMMTVDGREDLIAKHSESLSDALIAAIIEAKK